MKTLSATVWIDAAPMKVWAPFSGRALARAETSFRALNGALKVRAESL
jgi:hypothetical protein